MKTLTYVSVGIALCTSTALCQTNFTTQTPTPHVRKQFAITALASPAPIGPEREGASGIMTQRTYETSGNTTYRLSALRVWQENYRVVALQAKYESTTTNECGAVVGTHGTEDPQEWDFGQNETLIQVDGQLSSTGVVALAFTTLPISRNSQGQVFGQTATYMTKQWLHPPHSGATLVPLLASTTFYEADGGYPLSELIGFWGHLDSAGRIASLGFIRQATPKHNVGFAPLASSDGYLANVGESSILRPTPHQPVFLGESIQRIRSWVDPKTQRILGLQFDWYDPQLAPMIIGDPATGQLQCDYSVGYHSGIILVRADFDTSGFLVKLDIQFQAMRKPGNTPSDGSNVYLTLGQGTVMWDQGRVDTMEGPVGSFYELLLGGVT